jgi:hypothetical protein
MPRRSAERWVRLFFDPDDGLALSARGMQAACGTRPEVLALKAMWAALVRTRRVFGTLEVMLEAQVPQRFCPPHPDRLAHVGKARQVLQEWPNVRQTR